MCLRNTAEVDSTSLTQSLSAFLFHKYFSFFYANVISVHLLSELKNHPLSYLCLTDVFRGRPCLQHNIK